MDGRTVAYECSGHEKELTTELIRLSVVINYSVQPESLKLVSETYH